MKKKSTRSSKLYHELWQEWPHILLALCTLAAVVSVLVALEP